MDYSFFKKNCPYWREIMTLFLKQGSQFEIRCWKEERTSILKACKSGCISEKDSTDYEVSIKGTLEKSIINEILNPDMDDINEKMTEFFTININGQIDIEHYGKEIYIFNPEENIKDRLYEIIEPVQEYFSIEEYEQL